MSEGATRFVIAVVVVACIGGLVLAVSRTRQGDPQPTISGGAESIVELLVPANGDEVVSQHPVTIDLTVAWTADLVIAGREIPEDQLNRRPELGQVIFEPGEGQEFERLPAGLVCVTAYLWPVTGERTPDSRTVDWCFTVV